MQGVKIEINQQNISQVKKTFASLLTDLQKKAKDNPIQIGVADLNQLKEQLKKVEDQVKKSSDNINKSTKESVANATKGNTYEQFRQAMKTVEDGIKNSGGTIIDIQSKMNAKTREITSATVKYSDGLGKVKTDLYAIEEKFNKIGDMNILDSLDLKRVSTIDDNNIGKQQSDSYAKAKAELGIIQNLKIQEAKLDKENVMTRDILNKQILEHSKEYNNIVNTKIKINDTTQQDALNQEQVNKLTNTQKNNEEAILRLKTKQNDVKASTTSTTTSGKMDLGEAVKTNIPFNFNASKKELDEYARSVGGIGAEWTKMTPKLDSNGNKLKEINVRTKEGGTHWRNYTMTLDSTSKEIYKVDRGLSDLNSRQTGFISRMKNAVVKTVAVSNGNI